MKKYASIALVLVLTLSLCACGRKDKQTTPTTIPTTTTTGPSTTVTEDTILPDIMDPTMDSLLPDSGLLDTSESTQEHLGTSDGAMG